MKPKSYVAGGRWARRITRANREKGSLPAARALGLRRACQRCLGRRD